MMPKYIKKPIAVEALQWTGDNKTEMLRFCTSGYILYPKHDNDPQLKINTLEGLMHARIGDYIIKGIKGEFYPCREDIFLETYNEVIE
jgi:hypothetical protein